MISETEKLRRKKISEKLTGFKRPPFSAEHRMKLRLANLGKKLSPKNKAILLSYAIGNKVNVGRRHSEEWKQKMRGRIPWNKGIPMTEETKQKMVAKKVGKQSPKKGIPQPKMRGSNHPNWKGGSSELKLIRNQIEAILWRISVFERDNFSCGFCKKRGVKLNAHHIKRFKDFKDLRFDINNGITLCLPCHDATKGKEEKFEQKCYDILCKK